MATSTGRGELTPVSFPSCPELFTPQHLTVPSVRSAHVWKSPASTAFAVEMLLTVTGEMVEVKEAPAPGGVNPTVTPPFPSWPKLFSPQHLIVEPVTRAHVCWNPAEISAEVLMDAACTGVDETVTFTSGMRLTSVQKEPSCPELLSPQHLTVPSEMVAQVWFVPAEMCVAVKMPVTATGMFELEIELFPSWPKEFKPQHLTVPSERRAQEWFPPAETSVAPVMPETATGALELELEPFPSSPKVFLPQQKTLPSDKRAQEWLPPAETSDAAAMPDTTTGVVEVVVVEFPSWPLVFSPQHRTPPSDSAAQEWAPPALMRLTPDMPVTATGFKALMKVPLPTWPEVFKPQHLAEPPEMTSQVCESPAEMTVALTPGVEGEDSTPPPPQPLRRNRVNNAEIADFFMKVDPAGA